MKLIVLAALACAAPAAAFAQTPPATQTPPGVAAPAAAKFSLDTPIEALVADPKSAAVLEANMPGIANHPYYDQFKAMSLRQVQPMSGGQLTEETLKKVEAELTALK